MEVNSGWGVETEFLNVRIGCLGVGFEFPTANEDLNEFAAKVKNFFCKKFPINEKDSVVNEPLNRQKMMTINDKKF